jgi:predicted Zn-dependent protease
MGWTRQQAKALADQILSYSKARECEVALDESRAGYTRFAANDITTSGTSRTLNISVTSRDGKRSGTVHASDTEPSVLRSAVRRSEELMEASSEDNEYIEGVGPQKYPEIRAFYEETDKATAKDRAAGVKKALELSRSKGLEASGFFETISRWDAIANKKKNFGFHASTTTRFSNTMRTADGTGSGWAGTSGPRFGQIPTQALVERAARKAEMSASPKDLAPGKYTVILEPAAVADLIGSLIFALSKRAADEGRSFMSKPGGGNRLGEKLFADSVTIRSDPFDPRVPGRPWFGGGGRGGGLGFGGFGGGSGAGEPVRKVTWIEKGEVQTLSVDRHWAAKTKTQPIPFPGSLIMSGGSGSIDDLVAQTERGLLITHFFYIRPVNPQIVELTGLTRDGVWLVEKGKIVHAVNNFRFNESPVNLLKNVDGLTEAIPTAGGFGGGGMVMPGVRAKDFSFTSKSDAV